MNSVKGRGNKDIRCWGTNQYLIRAIRPSEKPLSLWKSNFKIHSCHQSYDHFPNKQVAMCSLASRPGQNGRHFTDVIFKCIFMNEKFCILIWISLKFVPNGPNDNKPTLVEEIAWCRTAITWTNADPVHQCIHAALGGDGLPHLPNTIIHLVRNGRLGFVQVVSVTFTSSFMFIDSL